MTKRAGLPLDRLLEQVGIGKPAWEGPWPRVSGVASDSRRVQPGDLFVAIAGERFDGRRFAAAALEAGAVAVLGPAPGVDVPAGVCWVELDDPRPVMGALSRRAYLEPDKALRLLGVTGTNGKSTLVDLLASMLDAAGEPAARLGTLGYVFAGRQWQAGGRTTPEASDLHRLLAEMKDAGARAVAMEVSSHALELGRVSDLLFELAAFTNLSRDHLDFHGDMESYFAAKKKLFSQLKTGGVAVVHLDREARWGHRLAAELRGRGRRVLTCGESEGDVRPAGVRLDLDGLEARLETPGGELWLRSKLLGRFQLLNLITAAACGVALGLPRQAIERGLAGVEVVAGRLERVPAPLPALVDYAHTPVALEAALGAARELTERPIIVVFGCGGERDRGKRPEMARAAGRLSDLAILTSDNPRSEDPRRILADAEAGLAGLGEYLVEPDRRAAIELAVSKARELGALVLVAGKGHEVTQDLGDATVPFDDRRELARAFGAGVESESPGLPGPAGPAAPGRALHGAGMAAGVLHG